MSIPQIMLRQDGGLVPASIWDPKSTTLGTLRLWLEMTDISTLSTDSGKTTRPTTTGDLIYVVADKSGNGSDMVQATSGNRPTAVINAIGDKPSVRFTRGSSQYLKLAAAVKVATPFTAYLLHKLSSSANTRCAMSGNATDSFCWYYSSGHVFAMDQTAAVALAGPAVAGLNLPISITNYVIHTITFDGTYFRDLWDGVPVQTYAAATGATWSGTAFTTLGRREDTANTYHDGDIAGVRLYDGAIHTGRQIAMTVEDMYRRAGMIHRLTAFGNML